MKVKQVVLLLGKLLGREIGRVGNGLWHRVVTGAAPGVTAQDAPDGEAEALDGTMLHDGLLGVLAAGGRETAGWRRIGTDTGLVETDGEYENVRHET